MQKTSPLRNLFAITFLGLLLVADTTQGTPPITDADWPMYNHDVRGWRSNSAEQSLSPSNARTIVEKWRFPALGSDQKVGAIHATPTVVNGHVYFGTATYPAFYKLRPDGTLAWSYELATSKVTQDAKGDGVNRIDVDQGIVSSALVTENAVYFGNNTGVFYALDRGTGQEIWKVDTRDAAFPGAHLANAFMSSPILADGKIVVGGGSYEHAQPMDPDYACCTGRGFVIAFAPDTGEIHWKFDVGEPPEAYPEPIVMEDANGKHTFTHGPSTSSVWSTPSYDESTGTIFFGTDVHNSPRRPTPDNPRIDSQYSAAVVALDATSGEERWVTQINPGDIYNLTMSGYDPNTKRYKDNSIGDTPKVYTVEWQGQETTVVGVGCKNGGFYVLNADNGTILTQTPIYTGAPKYPLSPPPNERLIALPSPIGGIQTGCAMDGERIFANGIDWLSLNTPRKLGLPKAGRVVCVTPNLAKEHWRHERPKVKAWFVSMGDPIGSGVAVGGGLACFTTTVSKQLVVLDAASGEELKSFDIGTVWSGPSISQGRIYVGTGSILFLGKRTTGTLHSFGLPGPDRVEAMGHGDQ